MRALVLSMLALAVMAAPAQAQFRQQTPEQGGLGFTVDVMFSRLGGDAFDGIGNGYGVVGTVFYELDGLPLRFGGGGSYARYSTEGPGDALSRVSVFAMGAVQVADINTPVVPYIMGKVGYTRTTDDELCDPVICVVDDLEGREWSGIELGAVVGVDIPLTPSVNIDVAGSFSWLSLGDLEAGGQTIDNTKNTSSAFGFQAGFTVFPG